MKYKWIILLFVGLFVETEANAGFLIFALRKLEIERKIAEGKSRGMSCDSLQLLKNELAEIELGESSAVENTNEVHFEGPNDNSVNNNINDNSVNITAQVKITPYWASQIDDEKGIIILKTKYDVVKGISNVRTYYIHLLLGAQNLSNYQYIGNSEFDASDMGAEKEFSLHYPIPNNIPKRHYDYFVLCISHNSNFTVESILGKVIIPRDIWIQNYSYQEAQSLAANAIDNPMLMVSNISEMNDLISRHSTNVIWINNYPMPSSQISNMPAIILQGNTYNQNEYAKPHKHICPVCYGTGFCKVCGGTGVYENYGVSVKCSACGGKGKCWECEGTGYIIK